MPRSVSCSATANRLNSIALVYHSDEQNWGACAELLGPGVEVHGQMRTFSLSQLTEGLHEAFPDVPSWQVSASAPGASPWHARP